MASDVSISFGGELDELKRSLQNMEGNIEAWGDNVKAIGIGAFAAWGASKAIGITTDLIAGAAEALGEYMAMAREAAQVDAKLEAVIRATGNAAGFTADELADIALVYRDLTNIDDDVIKGAQTVLATFKEIKGDQFTRATAAALDMSTVLGGDLSGAAMQLGKALNEPLRGMAALSKSGVSFTAEQKALVESMVEVGNVAGAQNIILAEMEAQFGGAAKAAADAAGGGLAKVQFIIEDLQEEIGGRLLPIIDDLGPALEFVATEVAEEIRALMDTFEDMESALGSAFDAEGPAENLIAALAAVENAAKRTFMEIQKQVVGAQRFAEIIANPIDSVFDVHMTDLEKRYLGIVEDLEGMTTNEEAVQQALAGFREFKEERAADREKKTAEFMPSKGEGKPAPDVPTMDEVGRTMKGWFDQLTGKDQGPKSIEDFKVIANSFTAGITKISDTVFSGLGTPFSGAMSGIESQLAGKNREPEGDKKEPAAAAFEDLQGLFKRIQTSAASESPEAKATEKVADEVRDGNATSKKSADTLVGIKAGIDSLVSGIGSGFAAVLAE
jgi:hypothetical protein